ncbi:PQQ-binding-like beta-propeller repeat protein [Streptomyces sp. NPDC007896]|uniref:outer membrane protein assembly factor BamB family protein n=1 Tax=Streptomyces sp. NPDC007896 TaxID=3364784 RepID=UPI0036E8018D
MALLSWALQGDLSTAHRQIIPGLREAWHITVKHEKVAPIHASNGYLVTPSPRGRGLTIRKLETGRQAAEIHPDGDQQESEAEQVGIVGSTLVVSWKAHDLIVLSGYEVGTGKRVWQRSIRHNQGLTPAIALTNQAVIFYGSFPVEAFAYEVHTGAPLWSLRVPRSGASTSAKFAHGDRTFFVLTWDRKLRGIATLNAVDAVHGTTRWHRQVRTSTDPTDYDPLGDQNSLDLVASRAGDVAVNLTGAHHLYSATGRQIGSGAGMVWTLLRQGTILYAKMWDLSLDEYDPHPLLAINTASGETIWTKETYARSLEPWGSYLIGQADQDWPMPAFVEQIATQDGQNSQIPLPGSLFHTDLIGVDGEYLVTQESVEYKYRPNGTDENVSVITAYRATPPRESRYPALAGLRPTSWPDACSLLPAGDLSRKVDYKSVPRHRSVFGVELPHPATCTYVPTQGVGPLIRLSIEWVAPTERGAEQMMRSRTALARSQGGEIKKLSSNRIAYTEQLPSGDVYPVYVRLGTAVLRVTTTPTDHALTEDAAATVANGAR